MKTRFMLLFSAFLLGGLLFLGNASGPAANGNGNRTGSPGANGTCSSCHSGGAFAPVVTIDVKNAQGTSVSTVEGDSTYTISVAIQATSGTPTTYGFQATVFSDSSSTSVGQLVNAPTGIQYNTVGVNLAEHSSPSANNTFTFSWKAPASISGNSTGSLTVYAYGNCLNGNGGTSGDAAAGDSYTLTLNPAPVAVKETELAATVELNVFPNPVVNTLNVRLNSQAAAQYNLSVYNNSGQALRQQSLQANEGDNQSAIEVADLPAGVYRLMIQDEAGRLMTRSFVKF